MACPTCDHTMAKVGQTLAGPIFHCGRCGTIKTGEGEFDSYVPTLVRSAGRLVMAVQGDVYYGGDPAVASVIEAITKETPNGLLEI